MYWGQGMLRKLWTGRLISTLTVNVLLSAYRSAQPAALISFRPSGSQQTPRIPPNIAGIAALHSGGLWFDSAPRHGPSWLIVFVLCSCVLCSVFVCVCSSQLKFCKHVLVECRVYLKVCRQITRGTSTNGQDKKKRPDSSTGLLYTWKRHASRRSVWTATQLFWSQVWTRQVPASIFCFEPLTTSSNNIFLWSYRLALVSTPPGYMATRKFRELAACSSGNWLSQWLWSLLQLWEVSPLLDLVPHHKEIFADIFESQGSREPRMSGTIMEETVSVLAVRADQEWWWW
jgi:hypothetical protein